VRPPSGGGGGLIWTLLGPKTIELIHQNVERIDIGDSLEELVLNSQVLDEFIEGIKDKGKPIIDIVKILEIRLWKNRKNPKIKKLAEKLDELREKMRQNLIESIEFLKELLKMAREVLTIEKEENQPEDRRRQARAALTELFESIKSPEMPIIVENVVNDIDTQVVEIVRKFRETFETVTGQNEVKKRLRSILWLKYQIKDPEVFEKAYSYVEQYYN
jgi:type I restriction enzyme R subunit